MFTRGSDDCAAVNARHVEIGDDSVERLPGERGDGISSRREPDNLVPIGGKKAGQCCDCARVIIHDEDARHSRTASNERTARNFAA